MIEHLFAQLQNCAVSHRDGVEEPFLLGVTKHKSLTEGTPCRQYSKVTLERHVVILTVAQDWARRWSELVSSL